MRLITVSLILAAMPLTAEKRMDSGDRYERLLLSVPMIGTGSYTDPRRPLYVPARLQPSRSGIIGFHFDPTDDGKRAIFELVATDRAAFQSILAEKRPDVKIFEPGKIRKAEAELEIRKEKKDFDIDKLGRRGR